jgi:hypothetical protein
MFKLKFSPSRIISLADQYSYPKTETELLELREFVHQTGYLTKSQLKKLCTWKAARSAGHVDKNSPEFVKEITTFALSTSDERARIESLTLLDGVAWPTASVILHLYHEKKYPILDFRALWSVGYEVPNQYSFQFWYDYAEFCREVSNEHSVDMRTLDRALWQFSKTNQKDT